MKISKAYLFYLNLIIITSCLPGKNSSQNLDEKIIYQVQTVYPKLIDRAKIGIGKGRFNASDELNLTAPLEGRIEQTYVDEGDRVSIGDPLCLFDANLLQNELEVKNAELKEAETFLETYQRELNALIAKENEPEPEDNEVIFLDEENDPENPPIKEEPNPNYRTNLRNNSLASLSEETIRGRMNAYETKIDTINKQIDAIETKLRLQTVTSPINGVIAKSYITDGSSVKKDDRLFHIVTLTPITLEFEISQSLSSYIDKLVKVSAHPADAPDINLTGNIFYISPSINEGTQTILLKAHFPNNNLNIISGQDGVAKVTTRKIGKVLIVPKKAIIEEEGDYFIYTVTKGKANKTPVIIGDHFIDANEVEIEANIRVDDHIITSGLESIDHGSSVRIINTNFN